MIKKGLLLFVSFGFGLCGSVFSNNYFYTKVDAGGKNYQYFCFYAEKCVDCKYQNQEVIELTGAKDGHDGFVKIETKREERKIHLIHVYGTDHDLELLGPNLHKDWREKQYAKYLIIQLGPMDLRYMKKKRISQLHLEKLKVYSASSASYKIENVGLLKLDFVEKAFGEEDKEETDDDTEIDDYSDIFSMRDYTYSPAKVFGHETDPSDESYTSDEDGMDSIAYSLDNEEYDVEDW